ncbi:MAG: hypothetical protein R3E79_16265 [Caldilineaceae bacterium]
MIQTTFFRVTASFLRARLLLILTIILFMGAVSLWLYAPTRAQPGANCSAPFFIDQTLRNGARWQLCWEHRNLDGIVLRDIYYTPPRGVARRVLAQGSISQVHVPYDDNSARFHDITDDGFGDNNLNDLTPAECPAGTLLKYGAKDALCQQIQPRGYAFKGLGMQEQGELLSLFSVSTSGEYNYIPVWRLGDDGSLELLMGATGKLQRFTNDSRYGWPVRADGTRGTSHIHNYYWRLDFDLGASGADDVVEEFNYAPSADNTQRTLGITRLTSEAGRSINPAGLRSWRIRDGAATNANGQPISYQLEPVAVGHRDVGPSYEPWTANDVYVTTYRECERYVSHNPQVGGCADNLAGFVNGESLEGADVVLWYGATFHHIPRDEDEVYMHMHWNGFRLTPRDWLDANPAAAAITTCAVGDVTCDAQVDAADALFMLQYDVRLRTTSDQLPLPAGTLYSYACDVSGEGACNAIDALLTLQCSVGLANKFCAPAAGVRAAQATAAAPTPVVVAVGADTVDVSGAIRVPVRATATELGALSTVLRYSSAWPGAVTCLTNSEQGVDLATCSVDPETGTVRFSLVATAGSTGEVALGEVLFAQPEQEARSVPALAIQTGVAVDVSGERLSIQTMYDNLSEQLYLPLIVQ